MRSRPSQGTSRSGAATLALLTLSCATQSPLPSPEPDDSDLVEGSVFVSEPAPIEPGVASRPGEYDLGLDVTHYEIELALGTTNRFQARASIRVIATENDVRALPLDLSGLAVSRVRVDGRAVPPSIARGKVVVPLDPPRARGGRFEVEIEYGGEPDDGLVLGPTLHGSRSAFADNWPNRARFWFPSIDHPSDKATIAFTVHAPEAWQVIANGALAEGPTPTPADALGGGTDKRTWHWRSDVPHPTYTMVVGAAEFAIRDVGLAACGSAPASPRDDGCIEVSYWVFPQDTAAAARIFRRAVDMTDHFTQLIGPYPYEKLAHVQSSTRFGGMENSSAIFYSQRAIASGEPRLEGTVSHEIAHQWFGDSATEADWHHLWLSEGFASYFGAQFFEHADGPEAFKRRLAEQRSTYLGSNVQNRPIVDEEEQSLFALLNANSYQKGSWVLHMLRGVVGDEVFFDSVRRYFGAHMDDTAMTEDFRHAVESEHGRDLAWFFDQWIYGTGHPIYQLSWEWIEGRVTVTVRQTQPTAWPTFDMPATIAMELSSGEVREDVRIRDREQSFRFDTDSEPRAVVLDPDDWILKEVRQ